MMYTNDRITYRVPTYGRVRSPQHRMHAGWLAGWLIALLLVTFGAWAFYNFEYGTEHHETFTITRLDDQSSGNGHKYLVFARLPDGTLKVYEDTDAWFHGKTNSSDLFAALSVGEKVDCNLYGWRNHLLSSYQDLLSCQKVG